MDETRRSQPPDDTPKTPGLDSGPGVAANPESKMPTDIRKVGCDAPDVPVLPDVAAARALIASHDWREMDRRIAITYQGMDDHGYASVRANELADANPGTFITIDRTLVGKALHRMSDSVAKEEMAALWNEASERYACVAASRDIPVYHVEGAADRPTSFVTAEQQHLDNIISSEPLHPDVSRWDRWKIAPRDKHGKLYEQ